MSDENTPATKCLEEKDYFSLEATIGFLELQKREKVITAQRKQILELERQVLLHKLDEQTRKIEQATGELQNCTIKELNAMKNVSGLKKSLTEKYELSNDVWGYDPETLEIKV